MEVLNSLCQLPNQNGEFDTVILMKNYYLIKHQRTCLKYMETSLR